MKKVLSLVLTLAMLLSMTAFAQRKPRPPSTCGRSRCGSNDGSFETELIAAFEAANPGIKVQLTTIDYQAGDDKLNAAIEAGTGPDVLFETPQRINKYGATAS